MQPAQDRTAKNVSGRSTLRQSLAIQTAALLLRTGYAIEYERAKVRVSDSIRLLIQMISYTSEYVSKVN
jgi:hypothetical protein